MEFYRLILKIIKIFILLSDSFEEEVVFHVLSFCRAFKFPLCKSYSFLISVILKYVSISLKEKNKQFNETLKDWIILKRNSEKSQLLSNQNQPKWPSLFFDSLDFFPVSFLFCYFCALMFHKINNVSFIQSCTPKLNSKLKIPVCIYKMYLVSFILTALGIW